MQRPYVPYSTHLPPHPPAVMGADFKEIARAGGRDEKGRWTLSEIGTFFSLICCLVIYGNLCIAQRLESCSALYERGYGKDMWPSWLRSTSNMSAQQVSSMPPGVMESNQSPVLLTHSFQRGRMWEENKPLRGGCNLQSNKC